MMIVNLISPDGRYDAIFLSNYATIYLKDELGRLPGVAGINYIGQRDYSLRAWLDPDKLAALNLSAMDVVTAISQQNLQVAAGPDRPAAGSQGAAVPVDDQHAGPAHRPGAIRRHHPQGRHRRLAGASFRGQLEQRRTAGSEPAGLNAARARTGPQPQAVGIVRLRDVARVELGSRQYDQSCTLDGQPVGGGLDLSVARFQCACKPPDGVYAKMQELKTRFPDGLEYQIVYDTTPFIRESVDRGLQDPARRGDPGRHRRARLPSGLAGDDLADDRRSGLAHRHVRRSWRPWASA